MIAAFTCIRSNYFPNSIRDKMKQTTNKGIKELQTRNE